MQVKRGAPESGGGIRGRKPQSGGGGRAGPRTGMLQGAGVQVAPLPAPHPTPATGPGVRSQLLGEAGRKNPSGPSAGPSLPAWPWVEQRTGSLRS